MSFIMTVAERAKAMPIWLAEEFPPPGPCRVRLVKYIAPIFEKGETKWADIVKRGDFAQCWFEGGRSFIDISKARCVGHDHLIETLIHEWAHLISAKRGTLERDRRSMHDSEWGIAYARIYRAYIEKGGSEKVRLIARARRG